VVNLLDQSERSVFLKVTALRGDEVVYGEGQVVGDTVGNYFQVTRAARTDHFSPSNYFYVFPMRKGGTWTMKASQKSGERTYDLNVKLMVGAEEEVATPAGKLRGVRIDREALWKQHDGSASGVNTWTYWYSSAVKRFVVAEWQNVTSDGKVLAKERYELTAYDVR